MGGCFDFSSWISVPLYLVPKRFWIGIGGLVSIVGFLFLF